MDLTVPLRRRRQPLLRGPRRLHPAPRPGVPAARRAGRRAGHAQAAARRRASCSASSPTPPSTRSSWPAAWTSCSAARSPRASTRATLMKVEPLRPEYQDRDARLGGDGRAGPRRALLMFPTLGCGIEQVLRDDIPATMATLHAFNRWLDEDWGFAYQDRIFARADAVARRSRRRDRGARLAARARRAHRAPPAGAGARPGNGRGRSFGHPELTTRVGAARRGVDPGRVPPRRQRLRDVRRRRGARATGSSRSGVASTCSASSSSPTARSTTPSAAWSSHGVFDRHPTLRVASIENGSDWVHLLVKRLRSRPTRRRGSSRRTPLETIRRHVWVTPYYEEDMRKLADTHRRRARAVRLRLAARRRAREPARLRRRSSTTSPTTRSAGHARQRARAARSRRSARA